VTGKIWLIRDLCHIRPGMGSLSNGYEHRVGKIATIASGGRRGQDPLQKRLASFGGNWPLLSLLSVQLSLSWAPSGAKNPCGCSLTAISLPSQPFPSTSRRRHDLLALGAKKMISERFDPKAPCCRDSRIRTTYARINSTLTLNKMTLKKSMRTEN